MTLTEPMSRQSSLLFEILGHDHYRERVSAIGRDVCDFLCEREQGVHRERVCSCAWDPGPAHEFLYVQLCAEDVLHLLINREG